MDINKTLADPHDNKAIATAKEGSILLTGEWGPRGMLQS